MKKPNKKISSHILRITTDEPRASLLSILLDDWNTCLHLPAGPADTDAVLEIYCRSPEDAEACELIVRAFLAGEKNAPPTKFELREIEEENWAESWKSNFHVRHVSPRLVIRPPWEEYTACPGESVLVLEPGLSFGTGEHETTQACLQMLDSLLQANPSATVLDIGCGTGILAIAAALLGSPRVLAVDYDPAAVRVARDNAVSNGVGDKITLRQANIKQDDLNYQAEIVLANLLSEILVENVQRVGATLAKNPASRLVLSGILRYQYAGVKAAYEHFGFQETGRVVIGEWVSGHYRRG